MLSKLLVTLCTRDRALIKVESAGLDDVQLVMTNDIDSLTRYRRKYFNINIV